jgi:hypothetical protein
MTPALAENANRDPLDTRLIMIAERARQDSGARAHHRNQVLYDNYF